MVSVCFGNGSRTRLNVTLQTSTDSWAWCEFSSKITPTKRSISCSPSSMSSRTVKSKVIPSLDKIKFEYLGGLAGLYAAANTVLFRLDIINITFVLLVVLVFSTIEFRAITAGLLFVLSCVLANFAAFIYMGIRGIGLTIDTVPVISLGIGLGVDYGIYIVARIRDEVGRGCSIEDAIVIAITGTGAAVFSTFAVMVGGILPWVFSPLQFHSQMSVLLSFLMFTNMVAGILILPAFIAWARPGFIAKVSSRSEDSTCQSHCKGWVRVGIKPLRDSRVLQKWPPPSQANHARFVQVPTSPFNVANR